MSRNISRRIAATRAPCILLALALLTACHHSSSGADAQYTIGGSVTGLSGTLLLQNNGGDNLTVSATGAFSFASQLASGSTYAVTVMTQPSGQLCTVTNGTGTASTTIASVGVACVTSNGQSYAVGGTVNGLASGTTLVLQDNAADTMTVSSNGAFTFANPLLDGTNYAVTVMTPPAGEVCEVAQGTGRVAEAGVANVAVACADASAVFTVGGSISGLSGTGLTLTLTAVGGATQVLQPASGTATFTFPAGFKVPLSGKGTEYYVAVTAQPTSPAQTCLATTAHGFVYAFANVTNVQITCVNNATSPLQGTFQMSSGGVMQNAWLTFFPDGTFLFADISNDATCNNATSTSNGNGVEYGAYNWNSASNAFSILTVLTDTNGSCGLSDPASTGVTRTLSKVGSGQSAVLSYTASDHPGTTLMFLPVDSPSGDVNGAYSVAGGREQSVAVFTTDGHYALFETQGDAYSNSLAGLEYGCFTAIAGTLNWITTCTGAVHTTGSAGFATGTGQYGSLPFTFLTPDTIQMGTGTAALNYSRLLPN